MDAGGNMRRASFGIARDSWEIPIEIKSDETDAIDWGRKAMAPVQEGAEAKERELFAWKDQHGEGAAKRRTRRTAERQKIKRSTKRNTDEK